MVIFKDKGEEKKVRNDGWLVEASRQWQQENDMDGRWKYFQLSRGGKEEMNVGIWILKEGQGAMRKLIVITGGTDAGAHAAFLFSL